jgi:amidase
MTELHELSATDLAAAIARREVSSREALAHFVARVDRLDGGLNAVVTRDVDAAGGGRRADAIRRARDGRPAARRAHDGEGQLLDGRDADHLGAPELAEHVPEEDAGRWRRCGPPAPSCGARPTSHLRRRHAELQRGLRHDQQPLGRRAHARGLVGGSAAALAARFTPIEVGSDIGGSIRLPAHMSGVYGHKPSYGIVPAHGQIPGPPGTLTQADLAVAGPMARTVADLELGLGLMSGPDRWNRPAWRLELPPPRATELSRLRVATWFEDDSCPLDPEVAAALNGFVDRVEDAGGKVNREVTPGFDLTKAAERFFALLNAALAGSYSANQLEEFALADGDDAVAVTKRLTSMRHRQWLSHNEGRLQLRRRFEAFFEQQRRVLLPVMPCVAFGHDHREPCRPARSDRSRERSYWELNRWMAPAGMQVPAGHRRPRRCRPVGPARRGADRWGHTCTTARRWRSPPPPRPSSALPHAARLRVAA